MPPGQLSLKQRLSALALAPSSPSSPRDTEGKSPSTPKRKSLFTPPWIRRSGASVTPDQVQQERVQDAMTRMIYQAGVDYETRPMVVLNASALPDPREVSYDLLLLRVLEYLNLYVESDYTVVFFAAGGNHTPGWNWVWKAYRSLSRKYRKNLKRLFIVHPSFFSKMLFSLAGAIISPKFFQKISYMDTLSELAYHVPLTQIDIPPTVYQENSKKEREIKLPAPTHADLFGVPLEDLMGYDGEKGGIPRVVKDCVHFLRSSGMQEEGLFRRSPSSALLRQVQEAYDRGHVVSLDTYNDANLAAVLLKKYLRDLPDPIFPESVFATIRRCPPPTSDPADISSVLYIRETLFPQLSPCTYILLSSVLHLMHDVSLRSASNRMDAHNLSLVLCPNLIKTSNPIRDVQMCAIPSSPVVTDQYSSHDSSSEGRTTLGMVIKLCIQRYYEVFDEVLDRAEALAPTVPNADQPASSSSSSVSSPSAQPTDKSLHRRSVAEDDEELDDAVLVMPIGPGGSIDGANTPPKPWSTSCNAQDLPYKPRQRNPRGRDTVGGGEARSMHTAIGGRASLYGTPAATVGRARSMVSIDKGNGHTMGKKGSISIGRGTTRGKATASGVEAMGITASGFFTSPDTVPPVPSLPKNINTNSTQ